VFDDDEEGMAKGNIPMDGASLKEQQGGILLTLPDGYQPAQRYAERVKLSLKVKDFDDQIADVRSFADKDYIGRLEAENRRLSVELQDMKNYANSQSAAKEALSSAEREATKAVTDYQVRVAAVLSDLVSGESAEGRQVLLDVVERLGIQDLIEASYTFVVDVTATTPHYTGSEIIPVIQGALRSLSLDGWDLKATVRKFSEQDGHCC
jgi:hypothetical protein